MVLLSSCFRSTCGGKILLCSQFLMSVRSNGRHAAAPSKRAMISGAHFIYPLAYILSLPPSPSLTLPLLRERRNVLQLHYCHSNVRGVVEWEARWLFLVSSPRGPCNVLMDSVDAARPPGVTAVTQTKQVQLHGELFIAVDRLTEVITASWAKDRNPLAFG